VSIVKDFLAFSRTDLRGVNGKFGSTFSFGVEGHILFGFLTGVALRLLFFRLDSMAHCAACSIVDFLRRSGLGGVARLTVAW